MLIACQSRKLWDLSGGYFEFKCKWQPECMMKLKQLENVQLILRLTSDVTQDANERLQLHSNVDIQML